MSYREFTKQCAQVGGFNYAHLFTLYVKLTNRAHNAAESSSWVDYEVYCQSSGSGSLRANHQLYFEIDGEVVRNENIFVNIASPNAYIHIASGSKKIWHNSNGDKQLWISASINATGGYGLSANIGETYWADHIDRSITPWISERSRTSTTLIINWSTNHPRDWTQCSLNGGAWNNVIESVDAANKNGHLILNNLQPSTTYNIRIRCKRTDTQQWGESGTLTLQTRPKIVPTINLISKTANKIEVSATTSESVKNTRFRIKTTSGTYGDWQTNGIFNNLQFNTVYVIQVEVTATESDEKFYNTLNVTTYDIARIIYCEKEWNVEDSTILEITNPGNCQLQLFVSYNDIEIISRNNVQLIDGTYELSLTTQEKNLLYSQAASDSNASFKFILKSFASSKLGEDIEITKILFLTKCWVKVNNVWKRALIWARPNNTASWKQTLSWVDPNGNKDWKRN